MASLHTNNNQSEKPGKEENGEAQAGAASVQGSRDRGHVRDQGHARPGPREARVHTVGPPEYEDADVLNPQLQGIPIRPKHKTGVIFVHVQSAGLNIHVENKQARGSRNVIHTSKERGQN